MYNDREPPLNHINHYFFRLFINGHRLFITTKPLKLTFRSVRQPVATFAMADTWEEELRQKLRCGEAMEAMKAGAVRLGAV